VQKRRFTTLKRLFVVVVSIGCVLFVSACATFTTPAAVDEALIRQRALAKEANGIRVSIALVGDGEARQVFGIDLSQKAIQALWLEIENNSDRPLLLLPTAIDPEYFAPLEVAFAYHQFFAGAANKALDEHLLKLNFPVRGLILPGAQASGYVFTGRTEEVKAIDIDLVGDDFSQNFTFFAPNPNATRGKAVIQKLGSLYSASELHHVECEAELRRVLEQFPCCVTAANGETPAEPINIVIIGAVDDWITAFIRRGYHYQPLKPRTVLGRRQDISAKKLRRGYTHTQTHTIRIWQTPIRFRGLPVWVAQAGNRLGGRFADEVDAEVTTPMDPYVDLARDDLTQDLAYSQSLIKIGYVQGAGRPASATPDASSAVDYVTDGLRVVLVFGNRPASLATITFFDWERLADDR